MRERLRLLNGTLVAGPRDAEWAVTAELPLASVDMNADIVGLRDLVAVAEVWGATDRIRVVRQRQHSVAALAEKIHQFIDYARIHRRPRHRFSVAHVRDHRPIHKNPRPSEIQRPRSLSRGSVRR